MCVKERKWMSKKNDEQILPSKTVDASEIVY